MGCAAKEVLVAARVPATSILGVVTTGLGEELPSCLWLPCGGGGGGGGVLHLLLPLELVQELVDGDLDTEWDEVL